MTTTPVKLLLGCGPTRMEGFVGVDIIGGPTVDIISSVDTLPFKDGEVDAIVAEHVIEHLTYYQFNRAMAEWYRVLKSGGTLEIECPDLLEWCKRFVESNEYNRYVSHKGHWPIIAHFYGHQRGRNEAEELSQVHKSGYTKDHLWDILNGLGYTNIASIAPKKTCCAPVIRMKATKI